MSAAVEQRARAHVVSDWAEHQAVPVVLRYDPGSPDDVVRISFPGGNDWSLDRPVLEQGLLTPAGSGAVRVWPCGRVQTIVEFHAAKSVTVLQFDATALVRFLGRTRAARTTSAAPSTHA